MIKIAVIADTHYNTTTPADTDRQMALADTLLLRTVHRLNRWIKPDIVLIVGDLLDDGDGPSAGTLQQRVRDIIDLLDCPSTVLPGNHDGSVDDFYRTFGKPKDAFDVKGFRFVPFVDPEEPGYNARRTDRDLARLARAREGFSGPIIAVQHVPIFPPGTAEVPYNYVNAETVIDVMHRNDVFLAVSGHYHAGADLIADNGANYIVAPALCESPFPFLVIETDGRSVEVVRHEHRLDDDLHVVDFHCHTPFAYCSENMDMARSMTLARQLNLSGIALCEHSGQLYYDRKTYWSAKALQATMQTLPPNQDRFEKYLAEARGAGCDLVGVEADCDFQGNPVLRHRDRERIDLVIGAMHVVPEMLKDEPDYDTLVDEFLALFKRFIESPMHILAHPFRIFRRAGLKTPENLFDPVAETLATHNVAAELNFHTNQPPVAFLKCCLERNVKLSFGTDAHNLYEVAELSPHLEFLDRIGAGTDVLLTLDEVRREPAR